MDSLDLLKDQIDQQPFRPFVIEFVSGATLMITTETELLFPRTRPELAIAFTSDRRMHQFEASAIARFIHVG